MDPPPLTIWYSWTSSAVTSVPAGAWSCADRVYLNFDVNLKPPPFFEFWWQKFETWCIIYFILCSYITMLAICRNCDSLKQFFFVFFCFSWIVRLIDLGRTQQMPIMCCTSVVNFYPDGLFFSCYSYLDFSLSKVLLRIKCYAVGHPVVVTSLISSWVWGLFNLKAHPFLSQVDLNKIKGMLETN